MTSLPPPSPGQAYMHVSALQAGMLHLPTDFLVQGEKHGYKHCPSLAFFLRHSASDKHFIFDLGLRKDLESYPPAVRAHYLDTETAQMRTRCSVPQDVAESCLEGGVDPATVEKVVISHLHFDHVGEHTPFTSATFILGGDGAATLADGYPENPASYCLSASVPVERTLFLNRTEHLTTPIGPFPLAYDLFADGSAYIIDTPGHCPGHVTLLVRTSAAGNWLYLGGDIAHDTRLLTDADTDIALTTESGVACCVHRDPAQARVDIARARQLVKLPGVEFLIAHDWKWFEDNLENAFLPKQFVPRKL
ncbi:Lactamase-B domain-containing protein [Mycena indigotica]|uniref:Lactamase-B domain-containing protein n=1 Tax=Mycena indigotica TaxID=2126181 RepID=A0A8H6S684_9AGAR|nr:Lactamase-B domain-containing protein [Mycena indigotica]KAF7292572.1 Lactamase-B domain-containing protein [Mycena indigotica]